MESPEYRRLVYREINSPKLFDVLSDDHWPDDLRHYRSTLDRSAGVPLWFIVADGALLMTVRGLGDWDKSAIPKIKSLTH